MKTCLNAKEKDLQTVMDMLSLREHHARMLLIYFRWDVHRVSSVLVEKGADVLFSLAGIVLDNARSSSVSDSSTVTCHICYEEKASGEVTMMDCGHLFCNNCKQFFSVNTAPLQSSCYMNIKQSFNRDWYKICRLGRLSRCTNPGRYEQAH